MQNSTLLLVVQIRFVEEGGSSKEIGNIVKVFQIFGQVEVLTLVEYFTRLFMYPVVQLCSTYLLGATCEHILTKKVVPPHNVCCFQQCEHMHVPHPYDISYSQHPLDIHLMHIAWLIQPLTLGGFSPWVWYCMNHTAMLCITYSCNTIQHCCLVPSPMSRFLSLAVLPGCGTGNEANSTVKWSSGKLSHNNGCFFEFSACRVHATS